MAFASAPLRHPQALFAPKPLDLLVIHNPSLGAGIVIGRPEPTPWMVLGVLAQPVPQRGIGIFRRNGDGLVALGSAVLPVTRQANRSLPPNTRWR